MRRRQRQAIVQRNQFQVRVNYLGLLAAGMAWLGVGMVVILVDPVVIEDVGIRGSYLPFGAGVGIALVLSWYAMFGKWLRAVIYSMLMMVWLYLRIFRILGPVEMGLSFGLVIVWEMVWGWGRNWRLRQYGAQTRNADPMKVEK